MAILGTFLIPSVCNAAPKGKVYYEPNYEVQPVRNLLRPGAIERKDYEPATGTTYYVSALGGDDKFTGKWPHILVDFQQGSPGPWKGLSKINKTLRAGDRAFMNSGVFTDPVQPENSGQNESPIQYIGWVPCVYLENDAVIENKSNIIIRGLYITRGNIRVINSQNIRIEENTLAGGSVIIENSSNVSVENTTFYSLGSAMGEAIVIHGSQNVTLNNNRVHNYKEAIAADIPPDGAETTLVTALV